MEAEGGHENRARASGKCSCPFLELRSETDPEKPTRPKAAIRAGCCCCACLVCACPLLPPHIGQGPSETGKGARRSLAVLRPNTPPLRSHCILERVRQPAKANCTMPQPTAYADALGHYLYLPIPTRTGRQRSGMANETDSALATAVKRVLCGTRSS